MNTVNKISVAPTKKNNRKTYAGRYILPLTKVLTKVHCLQCFLQEALTRSLKHVQTTKKATVPASCYIQTNWVTPQSNFQIWYWMINCQMETDKDRGCNDSKQEGNGTKKKTNELEVS